MDSPADRLAFRQWFSFLAESQFYAKPHPPEIKDCAALLRWAYRESLARHNSAWANRVQLPVLPALPAIRVRPADSNLFLVAPGKSAQFADASTLRRLNCHFVSRSLQNALPGDLLFYRQFGRAMPAHAMVYLGASALQPGPGRWVVYHTGPVGKSAGEIRKVSAADLLAHPAPEWRPEPGNPNFLGVWRWNLLRETE